MKVGEKLLFYYSTLFALFITFTGFVAGQKTGNFLSGLIFLPISFYFVLTLIKRLLTKKPTDFTKINLLPAFLVLLILVGLSLRRILTPASQNQPAQTQPTPTSVLEPQSTPEPKQTEPQATPPPTTQAKKSQTTVVIDLENENDKANIRDEPSSSGKIIKKASHGQEFPLLDETDHWYQIDLGNNTAGWISTEVAVASNDQ